MGLPQDAESMAAVPPDVPQWVETRSLLLSGTALLTFGRDRDAAVVIDPVFPSGALVGRADPLLLRSALAGVPHAFELVVQTNALQGTRQALPEWAVAEVVVHSLAHPYAGERRVDTDVVIATPPQRGT